MAFTVQKKDGILQVTDCGCYQTRNPATIKCLKAADEIYKWRDFPEITVFTGDVEWDDACYSYSKTTSFNRLVPEFSFGGWPEVGIVDYTETVKEIVAAGTKEAATQKVGWIGCLDTSPMRKRLFDIGQASPDMMEIIPMNWKEMPIDDAVARHEATKYMSLPELVSTYAVLLDIEGVGFSARLKYLLWSGRPVILVDRPHKEYFYEHLVPWEHYVPVKRDLSDLIEKTQWILGNMEDALMIAGNARRFCEEHLTMEACYRQWNTCISNITPF